MALLTVKYFVRATFAWISCVFVDKVDLHTFAYVCEYMCKHLKMVQGLNTCFHEHVLLNETVLEKLDEDNGKGNNSEM